MAAGTRKANPVSRPHMRWAYSMWNIRLNSSRVSSRWTLQGVGQPAQRRGTWNNKEMSAMPAPPPRWGRSGTHYLYSGNCLYLRKASSHSAWLRGGRMPLMRCHSTMDRPLSVSLVTPPVE